MHTAILTGLLSQVGLADIKEEPAKGQRKPRGRAPLREYIGARGTRFAINPGSSLARTQPPLVMAGEIVETTRLWARTVGPVSAAQVEEVGAHVIKRTYAEPHWSSRQAAVLASETVSLFGVPIVAGRKVPYARVNPVEAREIFLRSALVEGQWRTRHHFFEDNQQLRAEAAELEERTRRRDLVVDDQVIYDFYDARVPADVTSGAHFDRWWRLTRPEQPDLLTMTMDDLVVADPTGGGAAFPDHWTVTSAQGGTSDRGGEHELAVSYRFSPGDPRDGVSVEIPLAVLNQLDSTPFSWQVPGMRSELVTEMIRALPKAVRKTLVPAPEYAGRALRWLADHPAPGGGQESLPQALARALRGLTGERVEPTEIDLEKVPDHLRVTFVITGDRGEVAVGKDLTALAERARAQGAADAHPSGGGAHPGRRHGLGVRHHRPHRRAVPGRPPGRRLPRAGRRGQHRRADRGRERRPSARRSPPRAAPAGPAADPRSDQVGDLPPRQHRQARRWAPARTRACRPCWPTPGWPRWAS